MQTPSRSLNDTASKTEQYAQEHNLVSTTRIIWKK